MTEHPIPRADPVPYLAAFLVASLILISVWPGLMSYDSVYMLGQAREGITDSTHSVVMIYLWRLLDSVYPGPALLVLFHDALFLLGLTHVLGFYVNQKRWRIAIVAAAGLGTPLIGPMLVAWKDVGMAAFLMAGFAALVHADQRRSRPAMALALGALLVATGYRHEAVVATAPLLAYWAWLATRGRAPGRPRAAVSRAGVVLVPLLALSVGAKMALDRAVAGPPAWGAVPFFDLIGTSHFAGVNLLPEEAYSQHRDFSQEDLDRIYFVDHVNLSLESASGVPGLKLLRDVPSGTLLRAWGTAVRSHPLAYLAHRANFAANFVALSRRGLFLPTADGVFANDLGIEYSPTFLTRLVTGGVRRLSVAWFWKPWIYYLIGLVVAGLAVGKKLAGRGALLFLFASGYSYLGASFFIMPAADFRYQEWSLAAVLVATILGARVLLMAQRSAAP